MSEVPLERSERCTSRSDSSGRSPIVQIVWIVPTVLTRWSKRKMRNPGNPIEIQVEILKILTTTKVNFKSGRVD